MVKKLKKDVTYMVGAGITMGVGTLAIGKLGVTGIGTAGLGTAATYMPLVGTGVGAGAVMRQIHKLPKPKKKWR